MGRKLVFLGCLTFGLLAFASPYNPLTYRDPIPHRELRYQGVVGQTEWFTCGPAAVATLLHYYYGIAATEGRVLELALQAMQKPESEVRLVGINALALRQAMQTLGLPSRGFRLSLEQLSDYFARGGLPVVLHVTRPELHYVVAVGMVWGQVVLADPSWGKRIMPLEGLLSQKGFSGVALVPIPSGAQAVVVQPKQAQTLGWAEGRLQALGRLVRGLP